MHVYVCKLIEAAISYEGCERSVPVHEASIVRIPNIQLAWQPVLYEPLIQDCVYVAAAATSLHHMINYICIELSYKSDGYMHNIHIIYDTQHVILWGAKYLLREWTTGIIDAYICSWQSSL